MFLHHAPAYPSAGRFATAFKDMGWVGVDLFFVLSAYLLFALLRREHLATGRTDIRKYFVRRVLRIWPLFYTYVGICFCYSWARGGGDDVTARTTGHLLFVDNVWTAVAGEYNPLIFTAHLWTIAFEEQIYVVLPLFFVIVWRLQSRTPLFAAIALAVLAAQPLVRWSIPALRENELTVWVLPWLHGDPIVAGLLLAVCGAAESKRRLRGDVLMCAGLALLAVITVALPGSDLAARLPERGVYVFTLLAAAFSLIVRGCLDERSWSARILARQPLVFLGRISYGLYIWHLVGLEFGPALAERWLPALFPDGELGSWLRTVVSALTLTVALSVASYYAIERPFLHLKRRFTLVPNRND